MKQSELLSLMQAFEKSELSLLKFEQAETKITMQKNVCTQNDTNTVFASPVQYTKDIAQPLPATEQKVVTSPQTNENTQEIKAPLVGVFYASPNPDSPPFVSQGEKVKKGQVLCLIEAMKMMNELTSPCDGVIKNILVENQELVSFKQVLFEVLPC